MSPGPYSPNPREATCERSVRKGPHVWRHLPPHPVMCVKCGRRKGRRYPNLKAVGSVSIGIAATDGPANPSLQPDQPAGASLTRQASAGTPLEAL